MITTILTDLTLHGVTVSNFSVDVHYRMPAWTDDVPFGMADGPIIDRVTFSYMPGVDIDLTPIYDHYPNLLCALTDKLKDVLCGQAARLQEILVEE